MADRIAYDEAAAAEACSVSLTTFKTWVRDGRITPHYASERGTKPLYLATDLADAVSGLPTERGATS